MPKILTVSEVTAYLKNLVEKDLNLQQVWVTGEISNFTRHSSGHMYFTLKDESSRLRCIMFRRENQWLKFQPYDGLAVILFGRIAVYPRNGEYQLYTEIMEAAGIGSLYLAFEQLKNRLAQEGLFDQARKKRIPRFPRKIGVITSPTGAAVRDIIRILRRRYPRVDILVIPAQVQGEAAAQSLIEALDKAGYVKDLDLIIIGRGGGSIEELWAFNDERLARAIAAFPLPVISAVGHETDFTIADLVADLRAPTPSAAAELAVPEITELRKKVHLLAGRIEAAGVRILERKRDRLARVESHPALLRPDRWLVEYRQRLDEAGEELRRLMKAKLDKARTELAGSLGKLEALSPLATLARGYSICRRKTDGSFVRSADQVATGEKLNILLHRGELLCTVEEAREGKKE